MIYNKLLAGSNGGGASAAPGQQEFSGSTAWDVPEGVSSVCIVIVAQGARGSTDGRSNAFGGRGGNLRYLNDITVKAGDQIVYSGGSTASIAINGVQLFNTNTTIGANGVQGGNGGSGGSDQYPGAFAYGGGAGRYGGNGNNGSATVRGTGASLTSVGAGTLGIGGSGSGNSASITNGTAGGCRIMWGIGRAYPTNMADK